MARASNQLRTVAGIIALLLCAAFSCRAQGDMDQYTATADELQMSYPHGWLLIDDSAFIARRMKAAGATALVRPMVIVSRTEGEAEGFVARMANTERYSLQEVMMLLDGSAPGQNTELRFRKDTIVCGRPMAIRFYENAKGDLVLFAFTTARGAIYQYQFRCSAAAYRELGPMLQSCLLTLRVDRKHFAAPPPPKTTLDTMRDKLRHVQRGLEKNSAVQAKDGGFGQGFMHGLLLPYTMVMAIAGNDASRAILHDVSTMYNLDTWRPERSDAYIIGISLGVILMMAGLKLLGNAAVWIVDGVQHVTFERRYVRGRRSDPPFPTEQFKRPAADGQQLPVAAVSEAGVGVVSDSRVEAEVLYRQAQAFVALGRAKEALEMIDELEALSADDAATRRWKELGVELWRELKSK